MDQDVKSAVSYRNNFLLRPTRLQYLFLCATIFGTSFLLLCRYNNIEKPQFYNKKTIRGDSKYNTNNSTSFDNKYTINTEGCYIPGLKPLDDAIKKYVYYPTVEPCRNSKFPLLDNNKTHIWIKDDTRKHYNETESNSIKCCYKSFYRPVLVSDITSRRIDDRVQYNECVSFFREIKVHDEFVKVTCKNNNKIIYQQFFSFTPMKTFSRNGLKEILKSKPAYNVLILGIDAVSRLNFIRTMPETLQFLKNKGAVELMGYNKVGDNTFPNLIPMLLGIKDTELRRTCLPNSWSAFDNCPFIWEWFKQAGYYTAFGEDTSSLGTFNYFRTGFIGTPTDYYLHTFIHEAAKTVGNNKNFNSYLCMNEKRFYDVLLNYIEDLVDTLKYTKLFGLFWEVTMSHDYLNFPMIMDTSYKRFLDKLHVSKYLDETILFFISDHGLRYGEIRATKQGRLEERLPFAYILVPQSFRDNYRKAYNNLELNSRRLTTPYDIHATLYDLINLDDIKNEQIEARKLRSYGQNRSISLFLPIPSNRTCQMADIDDHWCTCQRSHKLSLKSKETLEVTAQLLKHLNNLLISYRQCAPLHLVEIIEALEVEVGTPEKDEIGWQEFMVVVRTDPGDAIFEATLRYDNQDWLLSGTVSRLNLYGDQSSCVSDTQLKLYCFCI